MQQRTSAVVILFHLLALLLSGCVDENLKLKKGDPAPDFSLPQLAENRMVNFPEDYLGKVVAIRFWADWCPYCDQEMRELEPVYQKYRDQGLVLLALNVHQDREKAGQFIKRLHISYDVLLDLQGKTAAKYQIIGLPTTYIVARDGRISTKISGESSADFFEQVIHDLL